MGPSALSITHSMFSCLAIFAHPDDEIGAGATLAYYADAGVRTILICASRGEAATIYCDECATRENLAEVRTRELECACRHLGIAELRWLDWPDGGIRDLPRPEAIGQVVALIRALRPQVILTHAENGLYPHPDHLAMWEIVKAAYAAAADPGQYPEAGAPWTTDRLFTRAISQSYFDAAPAFAEYRIQLNGQQLPFVATPDDQIDVVMQVAGWVERRMAAWDCHRSQHNPDGAFAKMPDEVRRSMAENEQFVLAAARSPLPRGSPRPQGGGSPRLQGGGSPRLQGGGAVNDLLAGLSVDRGDAPGLSDENNLRAELAAQRACLQVCQGYLADTSEPAAMAQLEAFAEKSQEMIHLLARAVRHANSVAGEVAPAAELLAEGLRQKKAQARLGFLLAGARQSAARARALANGAMDPDQRAVWEELQGLAEEQCAASAP